MSYLGIDPGKSGGIVVIDSVGCVHYNVMPSTELDLAILIRDLHDRYSIDYADIEKVSSSPQMGVTSAFTFGRGYGSLITAVSMLEISLELVRPQVWQKYLKIPPRKTQSKPQFKERLRAEAQRLFPKLPVWKEKKSLGKQKAICDALLIAEYCRRTNQ